MEGRMRISRAFLLAGIAFLLAGCGYNAMQTQDEEVKAAWSEVLNQYQRRSDLVPNLVNTVKGYAAHEQEVFEAVAQARAKVGSVNLSPDAAANEQALKSFADAQQQMGGALSRLLAVAENYPQLKADQGFRDLQAQLEGTENRITVARNRYIKSVQAYNTLIRTFPNLITAKIFGYAPKPTFTVADEQQAAKAPVVSF